LYVVPSGFGKSRIAFAIAFIALELKAVKKVHMVFENKYLLERD
jgi:hypothetical protein